jgi:dodecin
MQYTFQAGHAGSIPVARSTVARSTFLQLIYIRAGSPGDHVPALTAGQGGFVAGWAQQPWAGRTWSKESVMSVYRVTEIIGTSSTSWEEAAAEAIRTAAGTLRDLRVAEVVKQDIHLDEGGAITYRTKLQLSFKYEAGH